jgi:hypothetical protein
VEDGSVPLQMPVVVVVRMVVVVFVRMVVVVFVRMVVVVFVRMVVVVRMIVIVSVMIAIHADRRCRPSLQIGQRGLSVVGASAGSAHQAISTV